MRRPGNNLCILIQRAQGRVPIRGGQRQNDPVHAFFSKRGQRALIRHHGEEADVDRLSIPSAFLAETIELGKSGVELGHGNRQPAIGIIHDALDGPA